LLRENCTMSGTGFEVVYRSASRRLGENHATSRFDVFSPETDVCVTRIK